MRTTASIYAMTTAAVIVAGLVRWLLDPALGDQLPYPTFFVAVIVAAWIGGLRPALLATALGFFFAWYCFMPPRFSLSGTSGPQFLGLGMYLMVSLAIAAFGEAMRVGQRRFEELVRRQEETIRPSLTSEGIILKHGMQDVAIVGFGSIVAVLLIGGLQGYRSALQLDSDRRMVAHTHEVIGSLETLGSTLKDAEAGQRGFLLVEDERYLEPYDDALERIKIEVARLKGLTSDNADQQARLAVLDKKIDVRLEELKQTVALTKKKDRTAALNIVRSDIGNSLMDDMRKDIAAMQQVEYVLLKKRADESESSFRTTLLSILLPAILGIVLVGVVFYLSQRNVRLRQRAAMVLAEQKERLRTTLASIGDGVISTDSRGNVTYLNAVAETLTGWTNRDALGVPLTQVFRIVNESTRLPVENPATRALNEGIIVGLANHTVLIAKDGTERPIDDSAAPIRCEEGELVGCVLVFRDVGEQRRDAMLLAVSEARKTAILNTALDCILTIDHEGLVMDCNPAAERTFGYGRADVIGREMADLIIPPAMRDAHRKGMARYMATGEGHVLDRRLELSAVRSDGTEFPVEVTITRIAGDGPPTFTGYLRDITDRKLAERTATAQLKNARLNAEIGVALTGSETLPVMLQICVESLVRNLDGAFARIWIHDEASAVLELRASDGICTDLDGLHERISVGQFEIGMIAQERTPHHTNAFVGDLHGPEQEWAKREGIVAFAGYPLIVKDRLVGVMAMFARQPLNEATLTAMEAAASAVALGIERKEMADTLQQYVADLSDADRRKNEFLATLAHELRNPLAPIRNGLQLLRLAHGQAETAEEAQTMMERQLRQLVRLVDDLMDVSRINCGKLDLRRDMVQLAAVVSSAVETSQPLVEERGHELTVTIPQHPIIVDADFTRLAQVFSNLLNNSAKYMDWGGHIWLNVERQGSDVVVAVRDTGIGMTADQLPRIFQMFTQLDRSLEKAQGGLGIGLTLVRRLVELHGGRVEAHSEGLGKGSEFVVRLPVVVDGSMPEASGDEEKQSELKSSLRILIVDDNRDSAESLSKMLKIMGNDTRTVYDGEEAVAAANEFRPAVILLDIGLPKLNGYEACRRIREQPEGKELLIIAQTGWGQEEDRQRTHEAGFDHHMVKPVDPQALMRLLAGLRRADA